MAGDYRMRLVDGGDDYIADALRDLHEEIFLDSADVPSFEYGAWWVVSCGRELVGFCGMVPSTYLPNTAYLKRAGVRQGHRGGGLQRRMIGARERYARRVGFHTIYTDTAVFNVRSSNNLFRAGFELFRPNPIWSGEEFLYWRKRLA